MHHSLADLLHNLHNDHEEPRQPEVACRHLSPGYSIWWTLSLKADDGWRTGFCSQCPDLGQPGIYICRQLLHHLQTVLSRVMLACRNAIRSTPVPLNVVGGPSMLNLPVGSTREPCVRILLFSSRAVISSSTRPYVNLLCCVNFSVIFALNPTLSIHNGGTGSMLGPATKTGLSFLVLKKLVLKVRFLLRFSTPSR